MTKPFRRRGRLALFQPDEHSQQDAYDVALLSAASIGSAREYDYAAGERLVRELIDAFDRADIDAILDRFDSRGKDARSLAELACRIWRCRAREVLRVEARRIPDSRIFRAWVRLLDDTEHLLTISLTFDLDPRDESWTARVPELPVRWFTSELPWQRVATWDDACVFVSELQIASGRS